VDHGKRVVPTSSDLREKAEVLLIAQYSAAESVSDLDNKRMLHELQVHKIELEMQNEELHQTVQILEEHETHLRNLIKNTPAGYFRINLEGRYVEVNDAWLRIHGYDSPDEVLGKHFSLTQIESELATALKHVSDLLKGDAQPIGEFTHRRKDGSVGYHTFSAHPVIHTSKVVGLEWFIIDRSDQKRVEDEKTVLQHQFEQAQKMESLGILAGGIAHDFNNILAVIVGHCSLVEMNYASAEEHLPAIKTAAERGAGLCRQMLTYAGKGQFVLAPLNIRTLVEEMCTMLKTTIKQNVAINPRIPVDFPCIKGDDSQIRQVVMNLIINAADAIGEAQGEVLVSLAGTEITANRADADHFGQAIPPGRYVCLEVADNGCGMNEETKRRVFEPFYTTKVSGRGLGMSAVLGIIKAHGGALQCASRPGRGTSFKVYLPTLIDAFKADEQTIPAEPWQGSGTILLVEDEAPIRTIAKLLLENLGFEVLEASNGQEALELYRRTAAHIALVLTDIGMPVMNGCDLVRELRKLDPELPIIVSSGFGHADATSLTTHGDRTGFIGKPYDLAQLRDILKSVLDDSPHE